jgi:hypothetical protein
MSAPGAGKRPTTLHNARYRKRRPFMVPGSEGAVPANRRLVQGLPPVVDDELYAGFPDGSKIIRFTGYERATEPRGDSGDETIRKLRRCALLSAFRANLPQVLTESPVRCAASPELNY